MGKLVKARDDGRLQVTVVSTAQPNPKVLLRARGHLRTQSDLREAFDTTEIDREFVLRRLSAYLPQDESELAEVVNYIVDEHEQIGTSILVISPDTGKAVARLSEVDFYQPAPVSRETGGMVTPLPRMKPEIESYLVHSISDGVREREISESMLSRMPKQSLPDVIRRKAMFLTRAGRSEVAATIHDRLPGLIGSARGVAQSLFASFPSDGSTDGCEELQADVSVCLRVGVQDARTQSLGYDVVNASSAVVTAGWARAIGYLVLENATRWPIVGAYDGEDGLYIASANTAQCLHGQTLVVEGLDGVAVRLTGPAGRLEARDYTTQWREVHDKWTLEATLMAVLHLDLSRVEVLRVEGVEESGVSVEVLH